MKVFFCICKAPQFDEEDAIMDADDMIGGVDIGAAEVMMSGRGGKLSDSAREGFPFAAAGHPAPPGTRHTRHRLCPAPGIGARQSLGLAELLRRRAAAEEVEEEP